MLITLFYKSSHKNKIDADYANYAVLQDYLLKLSIHYLQDYLLKCIHYWLRCFWEYIQNSFITTTLKILKNTWKVISSLATLTFKTTRKIALSSTTLATHIFQTPWKIFHHCLHWLPRFSRLCFVIHYTDYVYIQDLVKMLITDWADYPGLHLTITLPCIFYRIFSAVLYILLVFNWSDWIFLNVQFFII